MLPGGRLLGADGCYEHTNEAMPRALLLLVSSYMESFLSLLCGLLVIESFVAIEDPQLPSLLIIVSPRASTLSLFYLANHNNDGPW